MNTQKFENLKNIVNEYETVKSGYGQNWILNDLKRETTENDYNYIYDAIVKHIIDDPYGVLIDANYVAGRANHYAMNSGNIAGVISEFRIIENLREAKNEKIK